MLDFFDEKAISIIAATVALGPPQAAPMAMRLLESNISQTVLLISVGHLGSALILFLFFQAIKPVMDRLRVALAYLWIRITGSEEATEERKSSLPFNIMTPGSKYFFLGAVAFVFAFGSFLGVAATQTVGMRRWRAFAAIMIGCGLSVVFWAFLAFYLTKIIDPVLVTITFLAAAVAFMWRGKILESRILDELKNLGVSGLKVLYLAGEELSPIRIAEETQLRLEEIASILEDLRDRGYIIPAGKELYRMTSQGLNRLTSLPEWFLGTLKIDLDRKVKK